MAGALLLPVVELAVLIEVGTLIGALAVLALLVLGVVVGVNVVRRQGSAAFAALNRSMRTGTPPSRELADAVVLLMSGLLLVFPGFVTDVVAVLLLLPFTRPVARRPIEQFFRRAAADQVSVRTTVIRDGQFGPGQSGPGPSGAGGPGPTGAGRTGPGRFGPGFGRNDVIVGEVVDDDGEDRR